jgi:nucleotide-binding universal stress UspA family protein
MTANQPLKILIAVDGSEHATAGVSWVSEMPLPAESQITAISVFSPRNASDLVDYESYVRRAYDALQGQPWQVQTEVMAGNPAEVVAETADQQVSDLIVIGARGVRSALGVLLGGVAQQVVEYANRPVLVVRAPHRTLKRIILALDGSESSEMALRYLARLPLPHTLEQIDVLHVLPPPPIAQALALAQSSPMGLERATILEVQERHEIDAIMKEEEESGKELLNQAVRRLQKLIGEAESRPNLAPVLLRGDAFEQIREYVEAHPSELIVVGSRGLSGVRGWLLGSLSRKLVHGAPCSVLVVRGAAAG